MRNMQQRWTNCLVCAVCFKFEKVRRAWFTNLKNVRRKYFDDHDVFASKSNYLSDTIFSKLSFKYPSKVLKFIWSKQVELQVKF